MVPRLPDELWVYIIDVGLRSKPSSMNGLRRVSRRLACLYDIELRRRFERIVRDCFERIFDALLTPEYHDKIASGESRLYNMYLFRGRPDFVFVYRGHLRVWRWDSGEGYGTRQDYWTNKVKTLTQCTDTEEIPTASLLQFLTHLVLRNPHRTIRINSISYSFPVRNLKGLIREVGYDYIGYKILETLPLDTIVAMSEHWRGSVLKKE